MSSPGIGAEALQVIRFIDDVIGENYGIMHAKVNRYAICTCVQLCIAFEDNFQTLQIDYLQNKCLNHTFCFASDSSYYHKLFTGGFVTLLMLIVGIHNSLA
jgi:hypothetical protein